MNNIETGVLVAGIFGLIVILIILYGVYFELPYRTEKTKAIIQLLLCSFFAVAVDVAVYLPLNWAEHYSLKLLLSVLNLTAPFVVYVFYLHFIYAHLAVKVSVSKRSFLTGQWYCAICAMITIVASLAGSLFEIVDGVFCIGKNYSVYVVGYILIIAYTLGVILMFSKKLGLHDTIASIMFIAIPVVFLLISFVWPDYAFGIPSIALSMLVIHTMLQAETEQSLIENAAKSSLLAHRDELTGLQNRLAYAEVCDRMHGEGMVGVLFADLNGLKYINDHYGHVAGDDLIKSFADLLLSCFRKEDVFRISGDEFVILLSGATQSIFDTRYHKLKQLMEEQEVPMASVGASYGIQGEIQQLIATSEKEMYKEKKLFHEKYPSYSRGQ